MAEVRKQPSEKFYIDVDFSANLDNGEALDGAQCAVTAALNGTDSTATVIETGSLIANSGKLFIRVQNGADGETHKLTFKAVTDQGNVLEQDVDLVIEEI